MKPGEEFIQQGIEDLEKELETVPSLLVSIGAPKLRSIGLEIPANVFDSPAHRLYRLLQLSGSDSAHSRYNALIRRLVSYERATQCET
ncbi:hypothetical protein BH24ACI3_BH24ACI3_10240 [soil metagenome]